MARHAGTDQDLLAMALVGYEAQKAKITEAISEIQAQLGHRGPGRPKGTADGATPAKRTMSAAARRRIGAAVQVRFSARPERGSRHESHLRGAQRQRHVGAPSQRTRGRARRRNVYGHQEVAAGVAVRFVRERNTHANSKSGCSPGRRRGHERDIGARAEGRQADVRRSRGNPAAVREVQLDARRRRCGSMGVTRAARRARHRHRRSSIAAANALRCTCGVASCSI